MTAPILDSPWMTVQEVATYARSSKTEVMTALRDQSLRGYQNTERGRWRVHRDDVDAWLRKEPPASARRIGRAS